jgi:hypothetical protein
VAQKFTVPISIRQLTSASSQGLSIRLDGETEDRIRIEAGGKILWSDGTTATGSDVNLYRGGENLLVTDDVLQALSGIVTITTDGEPTENLPDGAIAIDTTNDVVYIRSNGVWVISSGGGGASVTVSDTAPVDPEQGDLWFESDTGGMFVYYDDGVGQQWVEVGGSSVANIALSDTPPSSPAPGDLWFETDTARTFVWYDDGTSAAWIEIGAASTDAAGEEGYVQFNSNGQLGASAGLYWDNANGRLGVGTTSPSTTIDVDGTVTATQFSGPLTGDVTGNADTASALETGRTIELIGDVTGSVIFDGTTDVQINASVTAEIGSLDELSDVTITDAADGELLIYDGTEWVNDTLPTSEPMGHEDKTQSAISFLAVTRQFTIQPVSTNHVVWCAGRRFVKNSAENITLPSTPGLYYISYNSAGELQYELTYFTWHEDTPTAYVYWNGTDYLLFDERHGITLDWATHEYLHRTRGAVLANGFGASNYTTEGVGDSDADIRIDIANGTFFDEDLQVDITHSATPTANTWEQVLQGAAEIPVIYLSGTTWDFDSATEFPLKQGTSLPKYNLNTAGTWSTPDLGNGTFGITWIIATNILGTPIIGILGQEEYNNLGQAEAAEWSNLYLDNFPAVELRPLYKIAYEVKTSYTNTPKAVLKGVYDLRRYGSTAGEIPALPVADHGSLTGLADDDHLQYLNQSRHDALDHSTALGTSVLDDLGDVIAPSPSNGYFLKWKDAEAAWVADDVTLGTETSGDYVESLVAGTGVTLADNTGEGATPTVSIGQDVATTAAVEFQSVRATNFIRSLGLIDASSYYVSDFKFLDLDNSTLRVDPNNVFLNGVLINNDLVVSGDLTVQGSTVTLETETLQVEDNVIVLNYGQASPVLDGGIEIDRGSGTNAKITWDESNDKWTFFDGTTVYDLIRELNDISNVTIGTTYNGQFLGYNSSTQEWENLYVTLGDSTTGDYVENITGGTGVTIFGGTGEGSSASVSIGQDVSTSASVTFDSVVGTYGVTTITTNGVPTIDAPDGTLAVDTDNNVLYVRSGGVWVQSSGAGGGASVTVSDDVPADPESGDMWYESDTGSLYVYYEDGSSNQWVEVGGAGVVGMTTSADPPSNATNGDLWFDTDTAKTYVYYDDGTTTQWVEIGAAATIASGNDGYIQFASSGAFSSSASVTFDVDTSNLNVDGTVTASTAVVTGTSSGVPTAALPDGAIIVDTANDVTYIRSNGAWVESSGGASVTVSDSPPSSPEEGDLWYKSDVGTTLVYYDSAWIEITGSGSSSAYKLMSSSRDAAIITMEIGP